MTTYAMTDRVPDRAQGYLTPGKRYRVTSEEHGLLYLVDDEGDTIGCLWTDCPHIDGDWTRIDEPEATASGTAPSLRDIAARIDALPGDVAGLQGVLLDIVAVLERLENRP